MVNAWDAHWPPGGVHKGSQSYNMETAGSFESVRVLFQLWGLLSF